MPMIDWTALSPYLAALMAAISFFMFAFPYLSRSERRDHYKRVIEKRRRDLFDNVKAEASGQNRIKDISAQKSVAQFFKVQDLAGDMAQNLRDKMMQAGWRNPVAPLLFLIARIVLPVVLVLLAMMFLSMQDKEINNGMTMMILLSCAVAGFYLPGLLVKNTIQKRQQEITITFPDALDMMLVCVQGGIGIEQAVHRVADEIASHAQILAEEMGILSAELSMLGDRKAAWQGFARRMGGGSAKSFATAMIQAEKYGTSISQAMRVLADEQRDQRMAEAERKAAALPPKLTVPMITFFLPSLFIVILGPAGIQAMKASSGM